MIFQRRQKSKGATVYVAVTVVVVLLLTFWGISVFYRINKITVSGVGRYAEDEIIAASGIRQGGNALFLDEAGAEQKIQSAMPFIGEVVIDVVLPDGVQISVFETSAFASIVIRDEVLVIDSTGKILDISDSMPPGLIEIRGFVPSNPTVGSALSVSPGENTRLRYLIETLSAIKAEGIQGDISFVDMTNIAHITFYYRDRFTVVLFTG